MTSFVNANERHTGIQRLCDEKKTLQTTRQMRQSSQTKSLSSSKYRSDTKDKRRKKIDARNEKKNTRQRSSNDTKQNSFVLLIQRSPIELCHIGHIFPILIHRKFRIEICVSLSFYSIMSSRHMIVGSFLIDRRSREWLRNVSIAFRNGFCIVVRTDWVS